LDAQLERGGSGVALALFIHQKREGDARPAAFKVRVQNPKPGIKQQIAAGRKQLGAERAAAPARAAAKSKSNALEV